MMPPQTDAPGMPSPETSAPPPVKAGRSSARMARVVGIGMMVAGAILLALYLPPPFSAIAVIALMAAAIFWGRRELSKKSAPK
ncbi:MAG: hypothetical protein KME04_19670 [Pleurocapsa minor GSE-CHR-MK-17-07R]|nr:hypothetical protein [Pleurocapsa minor GSE-CHR-MK 17-07R]